MIDKSIELTKALADVLNEKNLGEISLDTNDISIKIKAPHQHHFSPAPVVSTSISQDITTKETPTVKTEKTIVSPIVGTFYASPSPDKPPFIQVGSSVSKGDVVCIVESMKLMNEITAEKSGVIAEILVNDGDAVEFEQPLIRLD